MFDFLIELLSEEAQKYKKNPIAYEAEPKKYTALSWSRNLPLILHLQKFLVKIQVYRTVKN